MSSPEIKNISLHNSGNQNYKSRHPGPHEGRFAIVTTRWAGLRWTLLFSRRMNKSVRRSRVVLAPRRWRQVLEKPSFSGATVAKEPAHRGEHEVSRKAIAQGMSECFRCPVCSCAPKCAVLAHETAGAARTRHSLRPLFQEAQRTCK